MGMTCKAVKTHDKLATSGLQVSCHKELLYAHRMGAA
jgi:hypothetical protein